MATIFKKLLRTAVVGSVVAGVAVGATVLIAGPERSAVIFDQIQGKVIETIDQNLEDPVALRAQLRELEREYPDRIADLRGDLAELKEQIRQLEREREISERVVALAQGDLEALPAAAQDGMLAVSYEATYQQRRSSNRRLQIEQTKVVYASRAADALHDLEYLHQQEERMLDVLAQLETEYAQFQAQLWQLERQVDAIARNERLIDLMDERQRTIDELSKFEVASLDHIVGRLSEMRSRQEAELEMLANDRRHTDYESVARMQLDEKELAPAATRTLILER
jgi:septal ring factor EnvC (AmiA/AmiB activator)